MDDGESEMVSEVIKNDLLKVIAKSTPGFVVEQLLETYTPEGLRNLSKKKKLFIATDFGKILGTIGVHENLISTLFIDPQYLDNGLRLDLLNHAEKLIKNQNYSHVKAMTSIDEREFFEKQGYEKALDIVINDDLAGFEMVKAF